MSCFERGAIVELDDRHTVRAGSNTRITMNYYIASIKLSDIITLVSAKTRLSDLGGLGLVPLGTMVGFWGLTCQALAQNTK